MISLLFHVNKMLPDSESLEPELVGFGIKGKDTAFSYLRPDKKGKATALTFINEKGMEQAFSGFYFSLEREK